MLTENAASPDVDFHHAYRPASKLDEAIPLASTQLLHLQGPQGFWVFELEADCTIPSEYILMMHYMDEINPGLQAKIAHFLRSQQSGDGTRCIAVAQAILVAPSKSAGAAFCCYANWWMLSRSLDLSSSVVLLMWVLGRYRNQLER